MLSLCHSHQSVSVGHTSEWAIHLYGPFICMGHLTHTFADNDRVD